MKRITLALPSPYVGLRPFGEREALLFFGRDAHVRQLLAKLERRQRFIALLGPSGTGKSSLVRAGLVPALHRGALHPRQPADAAASPYRWNVCILKPGDAPLRNLAEALTEDGRWADRADRADSVSALASALGASPRALADLFRQKAARFADESLLLVVDQFEEIFRYRQRDSDEAESFVKLLLRSASEDVPIYVVTTMRSDFLGHCVSFTGLPEAINEGLYLTPRLDAEQVKSVIASPLALVGGEIDPVLVNRLVNSLGEEDELPVLQHALLRMWNRARAAGRTRIEAQDFEAVCAPRAAAEDDARSGNAKPAASLPDTPLLAYAIDNHAEEIHGALTPAQQAVARQFFLALVERRDGRDVRRPQTVDQLLAQLGPDSAADLRAVIDAFRAEGAGFVLPAAGEALHGDTSIDISHESLIRLWRRFRDWLDEEEQDVAELKDWQRLARRCEAEGGGWLDEEDCRRAGRWRERVAGRADPGRWAPRYAGPAAWQRIGRYVEASLARVNAARDEREALQRSAEEERLKRVEAEARLQSEAAQRAEVEKVHAQREREQALTLARVSRRRSRIALAAALLATVFGVLAGWSWWQADSAKKRAEVMARNARANELATTAESFAVTLPDRSILLAVAARRLGSSAKADGLLRAARSAYPFTAVLRGHEGWILSARFSTDGKSVVTASMDKTARLWDVASGKELHVLRGHEGWVSGAQFSADGKRVVTSSHDRTVRIWDVASGKELQVLLGHSAEVWCAQFSADGKRVVTGGWDSTARLWDVASGKQLQLLGHESAVSGAQFSADGKMVVTASQDRTARLWDVASGKELQVLHAHEGMFSDAQFSADGRMVVTASSDKTARLWDVASGKELQVLRGHEGNLSSARFSADGKTVVTASGDKTVRLWDAASGKELHVLRGHEDSVLDAQFSADGETVVTASADKTARLWDVTSGKVVQVLRGHEDQILSAQFSADDKTVVTASADKTARLWDVISGREVQVLRGHKSVLQGVQFSADDKTVVTASGDGTARLWDVASGKELQVLRGHENQVLSAQFAADGRTVVTASLDWTARLWDVVSGKQLHVLRGHEGSLSSAQFSSDGRTVVTASEDKTARLWDVVSGKELRMLRGHEDRISIARFSAEGKTVVTASGDMTARLWDVASGKELRMLSGHKGSLSSVQFSADGKTVVTASGDKTARLWDVASGKELQVLRGHEDWLSDAQFSADGKMVVTASQDRTARLWDAASGKELQVLRGHQGLIWVAQFSADGRTVMTASEDNTARLWDVASGKEVQVLRGHEAVVWRGRFSADGKTVVTASTDNTARLWRCEACRPVDEGMLQSLSQRVGRSLSAEERQRFGLNDAPIPGR